MRVSEKLIVSSVHDTAKLGSFQRFQQRLSSAKQVSPLRLNSSAAWEERLVMHCSSIPKTLFFPRREQEMVRGVDRYRVRM